MTGSRQRATRPLALLAGVVDPLEGITTRTPPEVRERILAMFKKGNSKYAKPFDKDRLAAASFIGTQSWAEYGQVVLQMAILDTLLSIEEKLDRLTGREDEGAGASAHSVWLPTLDILFMYTCQLHL